MSLDVFSAFIIGLLGSGHCLAMCGGITTMLTSAIDQQSNLPTTKDSAQGDIPVKVISKHSSSSPQAFRLSLVFFYHFGRIASYCLIGAIVGFTGSIAAKNIGLPIAGLRLVAALFLILLGLYIGQWLLWLNRIESLGKGLWGYLSPMAKHVIPVNNRKKALGLGALWGWLPCGLVYSTLTWSIASASWQNGALIMLAFGLGTLPALLTLASGFKFITQMLRSVIIRNLTAVLLIFYGSYSLFIALNQIF